jgi:hypothetical protein
VYDTTPIGHAAVSRRFFHYEMIPSLGNPGTAMKLGAGRVNFLSYCGSRLGTAIKVLDERAAGRATELDVAAGYGPFMTLVAPSAIGLGGDLVDLWDHGRRKELLSRFARVLPSPFASARRAARSAGDLPDTLPRMELAICLESAHGSAWVQDRDLGAWFVELCRFSDQHEDAALAGERLLICQKERLAWLGQAEESRDINTPFASGVDAVTTTRRTTGFNELMQGLALIWSALGVALIFYARQIAGLALIVVGILAILVAFGIAGFGRRASTHGLWRELAQAVGFGIALLVPPAVTVWVFWQLN